MEAPGHVPCSVPSPKSGTVSTRAHRSSINLRQHLSQGCTDAAPSLRGVVAIVDKRYDFRANCRVT